MNAIRSLKVPTLVLAAMTKLFAAVPAHAQATVPLVTFYSPSRGDYFTTSQPEWTCRLRGCAGWFFGDYQLHGMQGHVYNPAEPQPAGTLPLWHWWSDVRGDNFLTTNPAWDPAAGAFRSEGGANYRFVRVAGYINPVWANRHLQLTSFWNPAAADNAALATAKEIATGGGSVIRVRVPAGYGSYRIEGSLLPPPSRNLQRCASGAPVSRVDNPAWQARGNYIDRWPAPASFLDGDAVQITAPADWYRIDYWGHQWPVRGYPWSPAYDPRFPAVGVAHYALLGRVSAGRVYVADQGWFEANQWFRALGEQFDWAGACILYDSAGVVGGDLQLGFNDNDLSDNGGWANIRVRQWF